jgi:uncharacterized protein
MSTTRPINILVITKGHPFDYTAFFGMLDALPSVCWTHVEQPAAQLFFSPETAEGYDAFLLYDMPGYLFRMGEGVDVTPPSETLKAGLLALLDVGKPMVFLHHALAGWAAWPEYGEIIGGRFLYQPGDVRGRPCPDSGYRHDVSYTAQVITEHIRCDRRALPGPSV